MKPTEFVTGHYLEDSVRLEIPPYQRAYEWDTPRWVDLWRDVSHQYREHQAGSQPPPHFMGCLIVEDRGTEGSVSLLSVVDGQQRLLTLFVVMAAIRDHDAYLRGVSVEEDNDLTTIRPRYGDPAQRLLVRRQNIAAIEAILKGEFVGGIPHDLFDEGLAQAYRFFRYQLWVGSGTSGNPSVAEPPRPSRRNGAPQRGSYDPWGPAEGNPSFDIATLHGVLTNGLRLLELKLEPSDEESSVVFETMNSKSTPLRQFDLLRNSVFVRMPIDREVFYAKVWQPAEDVLSAVSYRSLRAEPEEQFLYEYTLAQGHANANRDNLHRLLLDDVIDALGYAVTAESESEFRADFGIPIATAATLYPLAVGLSAKATTPAGTFSIGPELHRGVRELMNLSGGPPVPLVLRSLIELHAGAIGEPAVIQVVRAAQSLIVREILCGESLSPLRATFIAVAAKASQDFSLPSVMSALSGSGWKSDAEVREAVTTADSSRYPTNSYFAILRGIEDQLGGRSGAHPLPYGSGPNLYSIEHIYPQADNIGPAWSADLAEWGVSRDDIDQRRYVLGNLTAATGFNNKKNGRKAFSIKSRLIAEAAPLKLNDTIVAVKRWRPREIDQRTKRLASAALAYWPGPSME